jgi:hypothetical protein
MFRRQQSGPIGGLICGLLFAVIGYFVAFTFGKPILDNAKASRDWPSVPGVITRSAVATKRSDGKTMYSSDVVYRYQVEGRELTCNSVFFGGNTSSSNSAAAYNVTGRYPEGAEVDVYYEPENPANAVLEPGTRWQSYIVFGIGLVFLIVGVLVLGSSLFYVLAAGAIIGGAAAGWLGGSSTANQPAIASPPIFRPAPPRGPSHPKRTRRTRRTTGLTSAETSRPWSVTLCRSTQNERANHNKSEIVMSYTWSSAHGQSVM